MTYFICKIKLQNRAIQPSESLSFETVFSKPRHGGPSSHACHPTPIAIGENRAAY